MGGVGWGVQSHYRVKPNLVLRLGWGFDNKMVSLKYQKVYRSQKIQIQGLILRLTDDLNIGFVYCRSTPNEEEIRKLNRCFNECQILMGDLNLSTKIEAEVKKLNNLCKSEKYLALKEITRTGSYSC